MPEFNPLRLGLKYDKLTIVLEYFDPSSEQLYHHRMRLRYLTADSDINEQLDYLKKRHDLYLRLFHLDDEQLLKLIGKLKASLNPVREERREDPNVLDLNKFTPEEVLKYKSQMDIEFNKRVVKPDDPTFQYDVRKEFGEKEKESGWDDEEEEYEDDYEDED